MIGLPNPYILLAGVFAMMGVAYKAYDMGQDSVYAEWDKARLETEQQYSKLLKDSADQQIALQEEIENERITYAQEKANLAARIDDLTVRLSHRPSRIVYKERPVPNTPSVEPDNHAATGCTGADLYREDGLFLIREAARGDSYRLLLRECRAAYDTIRQALIDHNER